MENDIFLTEIIILGAVLFSWLWIVIAMNRILKAIDELRLDLKDMRLEAAQRENRWHFLQPTYEPGTWFDHTVTCGGKNENSMQAR